MDYSYLLRHFVFPAHVGLARSDPGLLKILYIILHFMEFLLKAPIGAFFLFLI